VSIAAGVAALTSIFPGCSITRGGVGFVVLLTLGNLRGSASGTIFTAPTTSAGHLRSSRYGLFRFDGALPEYQPPGVGRRTGTSARVFRSAAFSAGSVALASTEAVSNGVPAFKPPEWRNARIVLIAMGTCFESIFLGMSFLAAAGDRSRSD
jgi:hypothetical protein